MVRKLATEFDDVQIARVLNRQGRRTGHGNPFTAMKVAGLRNRNDIPVHPRAQVSDPSEGPFTADEAAAELGVCSSTIHRWLHEGILPGSQLAPGAPWRIVLTDAVRKKLAGGEAPPGWVGLTEAAKQLGMSKQRLAYLVKRGKLPAVRVKVGTRQYWKIDVRTVDCGLQGRIF
jgi:excisionase family DNA binding protein